MRACLGTLVLAAAGCGAMSSQGVRVPDPCAIAALATPGPLAEAIATTDDPVERSRLRIREARLSGDPGFLTLAEANLDCALAADPADVEARRQAVYVDLQLHRFADAATDAEALLAETGHWRDAMFLGDARMERGDLAGAAAAYDRAMDDHLGLELYDRAAHLAWLKGDLDRAIGLQELAVADGTPADPEPLAWVLTALGTYRIHAGQTPNELGLALQAMPDYAPAHLALGTWFLTRDPERAAHHLRSAGDTVAARVALAEIDPTTDVAEVRLQDRRSWAVWLSRTDPDAALALLDAELGQRQDATTQLAWALAAHRAGRDGRGAAEAALATGTADPVLLWWAAQVLDRPDLAERALAHPGLLLPSQLRQISTFSSDR